MEAMSQSECVVITDVSGVHRIHSIERVLEAVNTYQLKEPLPTPERGDRILAALGGTEFLAENGVYGVNPTSKGLELKIKINYGTGAINGVPVNFVIVKENQDYTEFIIHFYHRRGDQKRSVDSSDWVKAKDLNGCFKHHMGESDCGFKY